jgi:osmotically-inducible protein OsmY
MTDKAKVLDAVRAALASEPRVDLHNHPVAMDLEGDTLTLEGEVASVAAKKLALEAAVTPPEVTGIIDRLRVTPAQPMGDGQIRELVRDALLQEPAFEECTIRETAKGETITLREPPVHGRGWIEVEVEPPEEDSFDLIAEGVRLALEKDPFVDASQLRVGVRGTVVTLAGLLPSEAQRDMHGRVRRLVCLRRRQGGQQDRGPPLLKPRPH